MKNARAKSWVSPSNAKRERARYAFIKKALVFGFAVLLPGFSFSHHAAGFIETEILRPDGLAWNEAVGLTFSSSGRMFVWERGGRVWIIDEQNPVTMPLIDISDEVGAWSDHGMLGFALHPSMP